MSGSDRVSRIAVVKPCCLGDCVMALAEDRGGDLEGLTRHGFRGPSAAVDEWADVQDGDATDERVHNIT